MSRTDPVIETADPGHFVMEEANSISSTDSQKNMTNFQASPFQSLGDKPEMELDLWEGQFNLSSPTLEQFTTSLSTEDLHKLGLEDGGVDSSTCWGEDSRVTMGTVQQLQDQVGMLTEAQATDEERYSLVKQDNSTLSSRIYMLEEQLREAEEKGEERMREEKKKNKELVQKLEREKQIANDSFALRLQKLEEENGKLREKSGDLQTLLDDGVKEKLVLLDQIAEVQLVVVREEEQNLIIQKEMEDTTKIWEEERESSSNIIHELSLEVRLVVFNKMLCISNQFPRLAV